VYSGSTLTVAVEPALSWDVQAMFGGVRRESQVRKAEVDERALPFPLANCLGPRPSRRIMSKTASSNAATNLAHACKMLTLHSETLFSRLDSF
jgi:hypothetical protein